MTPSPYWRHGLAGLLVGVGMIATPSCTSSEEPEPEPEPAPVSSETPEEPRWVGTWATSPQLVEPNNLPPEPGLSNNTLRQIVQVSIGGEQLRVGFSNAYGNGPLTLNAVHLAAHTMRSSIDPASSTQLYFEGQGSYTLPAGQTVLSDPVDYPLLPLSQVVVTIHFGETPSNVTGHPGSRTTSYLVAGDSSTEETLFGAAGAERWYVLTNIDVQVDDQAAAVVTLGDSITDGRGSTTNQNNRWPDHLARRLQENPSTARVAVLNMGVGGNAVLSGGLGPTAVQRFERDVLEHPGVRWLIVLEGVNDIGYSSDQSVVTRLIEAYEQFVDRARDRGILVYGVPILPFGGSDYDNPVRETARQTVNEWIRTSGKFDAVLDLDEAVRDPENPTQLLPEYDTGDHLHLNPSGYQRMGEAIDLALFQVSPL